MDIRRTPFYGGVLLIGAMGFAGTAWGQAAAPVAAALGAGGAATVATIQRSEDGTTTVRAVRLTEPLRLDGALDEDVYLSTPPIDGFLQQEPREGEPTTETSEVWLFFDEKNVYVAGRLHDSHPERMVANDRRRDGNAITQGENFVIAFDTYHDRRNGFYFQTNPLGAMRDGLVTDETNTNFDWSTVWSAKSARGDQGWRFEMAIPFKSLRYGQGQDQVWGVNMRRSIKWKNEETFLTRVPPAYGGAAVHRFSVAATLVGIQTPESSRTLELKPYAISSVTTDRTSTPTRSNDLDGDVGFDAKYGLTPSLTADFTYNTEFAQVEEDEQQVNLTRFSLFFPEKREFFLEGQGIFAFGGGGNRGGGGGGGNAAGGGGNPGNRTNAPTLTPLLFFSRRVGLSGGQAVPIVAGGRVTGRVGDYTVGLLNISSGESARVSAESTNFSVVRVRRDILRRSNIGFLATNRSPRSNGLDTNQTYGFDANFGFFESLEARAYYARSHTPETTDGASYMGEVQYNSDRHGYVYQHLVVGRGFNPEVGFLRRDDFKRHYAGWRFSPRPAGRSMIRRHNYEANLDYITTPEDRLESRQLQGSYSMEFQSGDRFEMEFTDAFEFLAAPFAIASDVTIPSGSYGFRAIRPSYNLGNQRRFAGRLSAGYGSFYGGTLTEAGYGGRVEISGQLGIEPRLSVNWADLPWGRFTQTVASTRTTYTLTPQAFVSALVQYNSSSHSLSANVRFRWEYQPGSDVFVVYSEGRNTEGPAAPTLQGRGIVVKLTRLFRL